MRLLIVFPLTGITNEGMIDRKRKITEIIGPDVEVDFLSIEKGPPSIESKSEEAIASYHVLKLLADVKSIEKQYNGILIWCAGDPGVEALREQYSIPVIGPGQAMICIANVVSSRFGLVTPGPGDCEMIIDLFYKAGLENRLVAKKSLDLSVLTLKHDLTYLTKKIIEIGKEMIENNGIESLLLGCMGFFGVGKVIEDNLKIPVIDPGIVGLHLLKMMVSAKIKFSRSKYPSLRKGVIL